MNAPVITDTTDLTEIVRNEEGRFLYPGNLDHYYQKAWLHLTSRGTTNYHVSLAHTNHVFFESMVGGIWAIQQGLMVPDELRNLGIASIGHDLNRSPKEGAIDRDHLDSAYTMIEEIILPEDKHRLPRVKKILWATLFEFPRVRLVDPTMAEQIIADVDLTQVFNQFYMDLTYIGLAGEMRKTPIEMVCLQEGFIRNIQFYTKWAQQRFGPKFEPKIAHLNRLKKILEVG